MRLSPIGVAVFVGVILGAFVFEPWLGRTGGLLLGVAAGYAVERGWRLYVRRAAAAATESERRDGEAG